LPTSEPVDIDLSDQVPVRLRGHHFLCILTYRGYGYTPAFVDNMTSIVAAIGAGRPVILVEGPDDICNGFTPECRKTCDHDCSKSSTAEIDIFASDAARQLIPLQSGDPFVLDREHIALMRHEFAGGDIRRACERCSWKDFCTTIAMEGFAGVKLFEPLHQI
jgi:hypothetical protein